MKITKETQEKMHSMIATYFVNMGVLCTSRYLRELVAELVDLIELQKIKE